MQLQQLGVNVIGGSAGIVANDRCNVLLQHFHIAAFVKYHLIDGFQDDVLQKLFIDCSGPASDASVLQATFAAPHDGFAATVVPVDSAKHLLAFSAEDEL